MINDRYKIIRKAGEGRSKVFCCEDRLRNDIEFAIKIIPSSVSKEEEKAFRDEFHLLQKLNHPNIINVFEFGTIVRLDEEDKESGISTGSKFFTLEYFDGNELYDFPNIKNESVLATIICQISSVLYYLHQSAFIYHDLKSENILVKNINGQPVIKFIDFGLTSRINDNNAAVAKGTAQYIAPEILRNEKIDHRVDLYSFGILLYKIIYGKFPFSITEGNSPNDQLAIYKAHLEGQFDFPENESGDKIIGIIKKLLSKDVEKRYYTSIGILEVIDGLNLKTHKNEWTRIPVFTARNDALSVISTYVEKGDKGEVLIVKGSEGAGKSTLLNELNYKFENSILITAGQYNERYLWQSLLNKILYKDNIYRTLNEETIQTGKEILAGRSQNFLEELKALFIKLSSADDFTLLLDDFNLLSDFDLDIFMQLIPLLQINKIKIVITEDSGGISHSSRINNLQFINLNPFTESQVAEFINKSFASFFPGNEIRKTIMLYSDLLPGNIEEFLKDLIVLNLLEYLPDGPIMNIGVDFDKILKGTQEEIYQLRLNDLDEQFLDIAVLLSMININIDLMTISGITGKNREEIISILEKLSEANIIHQNTIQNNPQFTSQGIKEFIYSSIEDKKQAHFDLSNKIEGNLLSFDRVELSRHLEFAGEYERAYEVLKEEIEKAEKASALAYKKSLLQHLIKLPLSHESQRKIKKVLSDCLFKLGELNGCIELVDELLKSPHSTNDEVSLQILKGKALIALQLLDQGKSLLELILTRINDNQLKDAINSELIEADFQMGNYSEALNIGKKLLDNPDLNKEIKAKIYRLIGLIEFFKNNKPIETIKYFEQSLALYKEQRLMANVASMQNNLGNMYSIVHDKIKAEEYWNKAAEINSTIGNIEQHGGILMNMGIYQYENCNFEKAEQQYLSALPIFKAVGDKVNEAIILNNLGEVNLMLCEYKDAKINLTSASNIFENLQNDQEKCSSLFLMGKLYYLTNNVKKFLEIINEYKSASGNKELEKINLYYDYLKIFEKYINKEDLKNIISDLFELKEKIKNYSDIYAFGEIQTEIINYYLNQKLFKDALKELNSDYFTTLCSENIYLDSYRLLLLGKLSEAAKDSELKPPLNYYEEAYERISLISVTELTWKILFALYYSYKIRGHFTKMNDFKRLCRYTIDYIADQFDSEEDKRNYFLRPELELIISEINS